MNRKLLRSFALCASLVFAGYLLAQTNQPQAANQSSAAAPQKLVHVATIPNAVAFREFQSNVQFMQAQRKAVVDLNEAFEKETDAGKKSALKTQLDQALAKLNENNEVMKKTYGFSLVRNYTVEIESAKIYMHVTDDELAAIQKAQAAAK